MNFKKITCFTIATAMIGLSLGSPTVSANPIEFIDDSHAEVEFIPGILTFDRGNDRMHVPHFDFGTHQIRAGARTFDVHLYSTRVDNSDTEDPLNRPDLQRPFGNTNSLDSSGFESNLDYVGHYLQVRDERGTADGWHVNVSMTNFVVGADVDIEVGDPGYTLAGAQLQLETRAFNLNTLAGTPTILPTYHPVSGTPTVNTVVVDAGVIPQTNVWSMPVNNGAGIYRLQFGDEVSTEGSPSDIETYNPGVQLILPTTATTRDTHYSATLTWTLVAGPYGS